MFDGQAKRTDGPPLGLDRDQVSLCLRDSALWRAEFEEERAVLDRCLQGRYLAMEHVGSTAIPDIPAKPIIDIAVGVEDLKAVPSIIAILGENGYEYRQGHGSPDRALLIKTRRFKRTHHLHVEEFGGESWNNHIRFRDCLICNPHLRADYMRLKLILAEKYPDNRQRYTEEKAAFIRQVLLGWEPGSPLLRNGAPETYDREADL